MYNTNVLHAYSLARFLRQRPFVSLLHFFIQLAAQLFSCWDLFTALWMAFFLW